MRHGASLPRMIQVPDRLMGADPSTRDYGPHIVQYGDHLSYHREASSQPVSLTHHPIRQPAAFEDQIL